MTPQMTPEMIQYVRNQMLADEVGGALTVLIALSIGLYWLVGKIKKHFKEASND